MPRRRVVGKDLALRGRRSQPSACEARRPAPLPEAPGPTRMNERIRIFASTPAMSSSGWMRVSLFRGPASHPVGWMDEVAVSAGAVTLWMSWVDRPGPRTPSGCG